MLSLYFCAYSIMLIDKIYVCNDMSLIIDAARLTLLDPCPSEEACCGHNFEATDLPHSSFEAFCP